MKPKIALIPLTSLVSLSNCSCSSIIGFIINQEPTFDDECVKEHPECRYGATWDDYLKLVDRRDEAERIVSQIHTAFNPDSLEYQEGEETIPVEAPYFPMSVFEILGECKQKADYQESKGSWRVIYTFSFDYNLFEMDGENRSGRNATYNINIWLKTKKFRMDYYYSGYDWRGFIRHSDHFSFDEDKQAQLIALVGESGGEVERLSAW